MGFSALFRRAESLLAVDIGSSSVKLVELEGGTEKPRLTGIALAKLTGEIFSNNNLTKPEQVAEQIVQLIDANNIEDRRVVTAVPAPSVFTKRIKMPRAEGGDLRLSVQMEAANFIPHNIDAVKLDYQVLGGFGKNQLDVLVVAVKNEVIESVIDAVALASLDTAIVDVDFFALQNMFETSYPEHISKTVALINIGARYSSIAICRNGEPLFTGDMSVGGRLFSEALSAALGINAEQAEALKSSLASGQRSLPNGATQEQVDQAVASHVEYLATEFNRQLSFFWNASGAEEGIDLILLGGGGALVPGLVEQLNQKTGIPCEMLDPFRGLDIGDDIDAQYLKEIAPFMSVAVGLGIRKPGDKQDFEE